MDTGGARKTHKEKSKKSNKTYGKMSDSAAKEAFDLKNDNRIKVLKLFFDGPNVKLHIRETARRSGLTPRGAQKILRSLNNAGLLDNECGAIVNNFSGNYDDEKFMGLKRSLNLYSLYSTGLLEKLEEFYLNPKCIVLFGSYSRGEDTADSDIDIAVITGREDLPDLGMYKDTLKRKISVHLVKDIKKEDYNFISTLVNGIVLSGYLDVV